MAKNLEDQKSVLVIDDDNCIREALQYALESEGYKVTAAENGKAGLKYLYENPRPCIVILDMMMPVMTGREFLDAIGKNPTFKDLPVIVVSATADSAQAIGAKKLIKKPADLLEILSAIEEYSSSSCMGLRTHFDATDFKWTRQSGISS